MNICMFAKGLPIHITGGMELHVQNLSKRLLRKGHEVTIITTKYPKGLKREKKGNFRVFYTGDEPLKYSGKFIKESARLFTKLNKKEKFDVVHSQSLAAYGYAKLCKKTTPLVMTIHGTPLTEIWGGLRLFSLKHLLAMPFWAKHYIFDDPELFRKSDAIITVNRRLCDHVERWYNVPRERIAVIYNGINVKTFKPELNVSKLRERYDMEDGKLVLSGGRIEKQKGYHHLLKITPELDANLMIVGDGPYLGKPRKISRKLNINDKVIFTGSIPNEDMPYFYNMADVFSFQSLVSEAMGLTVLEAMACGRPVVAAKIGGVQEVIEDLRNGMLFEQGNIKELKRCLNKILNDEEFAKMLGENARERITKNFSLGKMVKETIKVYEEAICGYST